MNHHRVLGSRRVVTFQRSSALMSAFISRLACGRRSLWRQTTTTLPPSSIFIGMAYICCRFKVLDFWAGVSENPQSSTLSSLRARSVPAPCPACTERALLMRLGWLSLREFSAAAVARRGCGAWCLTAPTPNGQATADVATGGVFRPGLLQAGGLARSAAVLATALRDGSSSWRERPFSTRRPQSIRRRHRSW